MFNREKQEMKRVPMMPVRDMVIFPQQMTPFIVGREASVRALEEALAGSTKWQRLRALPFCSAVSLRPCSGRLRFSCEQAWRRAYLSRPKAHAT